MDKVAELAMLLTVDANGNDATSPTSTRDNIVQWGFHHQFNDDARRSAHSSARAFVAEDGTAQIPEHWIEAWQWYNDLITAGAAPNQSEMDSDALGRSTPSTRATWRWPTPTCGTRAASATTNGTVESSGTSP